MTLSDAQCLALSSLYLEGVALPGPARSLVELGLVDAEGNTITEAGSLLIAHHDEDIARRAGIELDRMYGYVGPNDAAHAAAKLS